MVDVKQFDAPPSKFSPLEFEQNAIMTFRRNHQPDKIMVEGQVQYPEYDAFRITPSDIKAASVNPGMSEQLKAVLGNLESTGLLNGIPRKLVTADEQGKIRLWTAGIAGYSPKDNQIIVSQNGLNDDGRPFYGARNGDYHLQGPIKSHAPSILIPATRTGVNSDTVKLIFGSSELQAGKGWPALWVLFPKSGEPAFSNKPMQTPKQPESKPLQPEVMIYEASSWLGRKNYRESHPHLLSGSLGWVYTEGPAAGEMVKSGGIEDRSEIIQDKAGNEFELAFMDGATGEGKGTGWEAAGAVVNGYFDAKMRGRNFLDAVANGIQGFENRKRDFPGKDFGVAYTFLHAKKAGGQWTVEGRYRGTNSVYAVTKDKQGQWLAYDLLHDADIRTRTPLGHKLSFSGEEVPLQDNYPVKPATLSSGSVLIVASDGYNDRTLRTRLLEIAEDAGRGKSAAEITASLRPVRKAHDDGSIGVFVLK